MPGAVLYVDDDEANLVVFEALCEDRFEVKTAKNGDEALQILKHHRVAVLLADQRMPGMTGVELAEKARLEHPNVVRILITAYSDLSEAVEAINRGQIRSYLRKPWNQDELLARLTEAIDTYETRARIRELERHMLATERVYALGVVTAGVAHELRGPLGVVNSSCNLALRALREVRERLSAGELESVPAALDELDDLLGTQRESAEAMSEICRGLALASPRARIDESCDLREVVRLAARTSLASFRELGRLELELEGPVCVRGNRHKLGQVALNLIVNAFQAIERTSLPPEEGLVRVRLWKKGDKALLEVSDNGTGMTPCEREQVFHPFYTTKRCNGTGLGLAISQAIVSELGGHLECESEVGRGTRFRLALRAG